LLVGEQCIVGPGVAVCNGRGNSVVDHFAGTDEEVVEMRG
jgi:hypothetical protein